MTRRRVANQDSRAACPPRQATTQEEEGEIKPRLARRSKRFDVPSNEEVVRRMSVSQDDRIPAHTPLEAEGDRASAQEWRRDPEKVISQSEAISGSASAGPAQPSCHEGSERPIGCFIFGRPTGGRRKTHASRALAPSFLFVYSATP